MQMEISKGDRVSPQPVSLAIASSYDDARGIRGEASSEKIVYGAIGIGWILGSASGQITTT